MATVRENEKLVEAISELKGIISNTGTALTGNTDISVEIYTMMAKSLEALVKRREERPREIHIHIHPDRYYYYYGYYQEPKDTILNININF